MITLYEPWVGAEEAEAVKQAVLNGELSGLYGKSIPGFEEQFASVVGCRHGISVTSGTTALRLAVAGCDFSAGDEVIVSSSTNIATVLEIVHNNLVPVPVDSEPVSWNLNPDLIEGLITPKTRAIMPVHLFGHTARMDQIQAIAAKHQLTIIEDCAESHGAIWQGKATGSWGDMGCFSFLSNKIITTGERGILLTNNDSLPAKMPLLRNIPFQPPPFNPHQHDF